MCSLRERQQVLNKWKRELSYDLRSEKGDPHLYSYQQKDITSFIHKDYLKKNNLGILKLRRNFCCDSQKKAEFFCCNMMS